MLPTLGGAASMVGRGPGARGCAGGAYFYGHRRALLR